MTLQLDDMRVTSARLEITIDGVTWEVPRGSMLFVIGLRKRGMVRVQWVTATGQKRWNMSEAFLAAHTTEGMK